MSSQKFALEVPIQIQTNGTVTASFLCSPYDLKELALGHLFTRGLVHSMKDILSVTPDVEQGCVLVSSTKELQKELYSVPEFVICGNSTVHHFSENISRIAPLPPSPPVPLSTLQEFATYLIENAPLYQDTGGVHGAVLQTPEGIFLKEDIGRHCAVDKVVGAGLLENASFPSGILCTTGRISLDMLLKSASMRIPILVSLKSISSMAYELAQRYNITLVGHILSHQPQIFTGKERVS